VSEEVEKQGFIPNHFMQLFRAGTVGDIQHLLEVVSPKVTAEMNHELTRNFAPEEVKRALDAIGDLKAPGPDGMPAVFYKQFWEIVGPEITQEVLGVLNGGDMPAHWNDTTIALIPKVQCPLKSNGLTSDKPLQRGVQGNLESSG